MGYALSVDINNCRVVNPHLDPDRPKTPLDALENGELWALDSFIDYLIHDDPKALFDHISKHTDELRLSATKWSKEVANATDR